MTQNWEGVAEYLMTETRLPSILTGWNNRLNLTWWKCTGLSAPFCIWLLKGKMYTITAAYGERTWCFLLHVSSIWIDSIIAKKLRHAQVTFLSKKYVAFTFLFRINVSLLAPNSSDSFQFRSPMQASPVRSPGVGSLHCFLGAVWENLFSVCLGYCWNSASWMWRKKVSVSLWL